MRASRRATTSPRSPERPLLLCRPGGGDRLAQGGHRPEIFRQAAVVVLVADDSFRGGGEFVAIGYFGHRIAPFRDKCAQSRFDRAVVTRANQILDLRTVSAQLSATLRDAGVARLHDIEYDNRTLQVHLPAGADPTIAIEDLRYDPVVGRFSATITAPGDAPETRIPVAGRVSEVVEVPVPVRRIGKDEVIGPRDIGYERMRIDRVSRDTLVDAGSIVGMSPRRGLLPDRLVRVGDILRPVVVAKGSIVTTTLRTNTMTLSARARAIEDGGEDEVIRVTNVASQKTIEVRVAGPNQVVVEPIAFLASIGD